MKIGSPN